MSTMNRDKINILDKLKEIPKSIINGLNKRQAQETLEVSRKNWIINGDHSVNQRGLLPVTGVTTATYETTDRWETANAVITANASLANSRLRFTATSTGTGSVGASQKIEDVTSLAGKTVTVSAIVKSNHNHARILILESGATWHSSIPHSGSGNDELLTITFTCGSGLSSLQIYIDIISSTPANVSITSGDYIEFTNVRLEIGDTATVFEKETYAEVLKKCRRYYRKQAFYVPATTAQTLGIIDMRTTPTITGGGSGFTSTGTTADTLIAYQTTGGVQTLALSAEL